MEVPAQLRGRSAPRLPALGASQRIAGALVAAVAVLVVSSPAVSDPTDLRPQPAMPTGASHLLMTPAADHRDSTTPAPPAGDDRPTVVAASRATPTKHPTYRVQRQDTLWGIAERCLGAGERFPEIAALNYGVSQPDGQALTSSHWIYPGWLLRLPPDARIDTGRSGSREDSESRQHAEEYTVRPGDTLWDIASSELGAADRYDDIAALNAGIGSPTETGWSTRTTSSPAGFCRFPVPRPEPNRSRPTDLAAPRAPTPVMTTAPPTPPPEDRPAEAGAPADRDGTPAERADPDRASHAEDQTG